SASGGSGGTWSTTGGSPGATGGGSGATGGVPGTGGNMPTGGAQAETGGAASGGQLGELPDPDPNGEKLWVFLAFGQSNMAGSSTIAAEDKEEDERYKVLAAANYNSRMVGEFYPAVPPTSNSRGGMSPADFFGRKMVERLPTNITVAIVNVSIGGQSILLFQPNMDVDNYIARMKQAAPGFNDSWWRQYLDEYEGSLYGQLVKTGRVAK